MKHLRIPPTTQSAFTLTDLLAVVSVACILVLLAATVLARSQPSSGRSVCASNVRQLMQAWQMYADDYAGALMANAPSGLGNYINWVKGVIDYSPGNVGNISTDYLTNSQNAAMGLYVKSPALFHCPADLSTVIRGGVPSLRVRSYTMNGYVGQGASAWSVGYLVMTNQSQVAQPDRTFVLLEEHPDSINDGMFVTDLANAASAARLVDFPAAFHLAGANLGMADGHAEYWQWADARTMPPVGTIISLNVPSPNNPDVARLQRVASYRP